ncbi:MAG: hypothetical protein AVDCRST_MAG18-17 [uncultured Thermomicrobiales bacterium]|uniref:Uncharacterized protein n=1 Tax=uncultured Thermomicrobiales bacterium TaxID=1645740 RepID=A0A6J4UD85_9BACT|nr:MAG: hypothetical protein AVDCRST_MAG18-17 [uncultured Thermomicrobiales bacterium]
MWAEGFFVVTDAVGAEGCASPAIVRSHHVGGSDLALGERIFGFGVLT